MKTNCHSHSSKIIPFIKICPDSLRSMTSGPVEELVLTSHLHCQRGAGWCHGTQFLGLAMGFPTALISLFVAKH